METVYFLGIDISKKKLDAALTIDGKNSHEVQFENTSSSIHLFFQQLRKKFSFSYSQLTVCMEHTGIYSHLLLEFLVRHNIKVCLESAIQIKRSQGIIRGKNDKVDARRIAIYAYKNRDTLIFWKPQRLTIQKLKALLVTRERLVKVKTELEVPIREAGEFIETSIQQLMIQNSRKVLKALVDGIERIDLTIKELIKQDSSLTEQFNLATSVPGIGTITALNIIVSTGEFNRIQTPKKFACYAGVAPFEHSSGSSIRGKTRVSKMANMTLKKLLHLAAMSAVQWCEEIKAFYLRKQAEGKNKMSIINAVRNKLISRVYACIKNKRMYQKTYQHALA